MFTSATRTIIPAPMTSSGDRIAHANPIAACL